MSAAYQLNGHAVTREAFYAAACDPRRHVAVEACAGAGKTWMLVARIVRALLGGAQPQEILAITFTRKAAGEMRTRLSSWLRDCSTLTPAQATARLLQFGLGPAEAQQRSADLIGLHERVLAGGRSVEVRTMHAWYAQLLAAAPLDLVAELGLSPGMTPLEDTDDLMPTLMRRFQSAVQRDAALLDHYRRLVLRHGRYQLGQWLDEAVQRRVEIELAAQAGALDGSVPAAADPKAASRVREPNFVAMARSLARQLAQRDKHKNLAQPAAEGVLEALSLQDDRQAYERFRTALFTDKGKGTPLKNLGDLPEQAELCAALEQMSEQIAQQDAHEDHAAMSHLSRCLFAEYAVLKQRLGVMDMNDLERVAVALLSEHTLSGWVQQRLDARVRHLLIDEFQDTSPLQWQALQSWLAAYAGAGGGGEAPRVFIVGDPKQSIYRFRRAEPRVFEAAQRFVVDALEGTVAACDHTRRCAPGVVAVLNGVFGTWSASGESGGLPQWRDHTTEVASDVEGPVLMSLPSAERPPQGARQVQTERVWRPSLTTPRVEAKTVLREAEAEQVARAIDHLIRVQGVAAQDILVLARKRAVLRLAADALALRRVPHVAPEELLLSQLPEVQDLLAVLDVLASPTQALSLARALKSPLFGVRDAELLDLSLRARERAGPGAGWWTALLACGPEAGAALHRAATLCAAWARAAPTLPPHDLLDRIVHEGELMPRLAAAVAPERCARSLDAVRALLAAALELDGGRYASPYGFVRALRSRKVKAPASQQEGAVRLLTIHGAKGLEARAVFLMDAQAEPPKVETATLLVDWPVDAAHPAQAAFVASHARCPPSLQALLATEMAARAREEANALYVALTRAEERLFISRTPPRSAKDITPSWWSRLEPWAVPWSAPDAASPVEGDERAEVVVLPLQRRASAAVASAAADDASAAALGQAVHRTLEWASRDAAHDLPALAQAAAAAFAVTDAQTVLQIAERVLASPACRRFFEPQSITWAGNEVPLTSADGQPRRIDRLVLLAAPERCWWVLDYKLSGAPQDDAALLAQLADYRAGVAALVPGEAVRAAFITARGELIEPGG
jgi:ATP-dependent helicase/nuclease subunit A